MLNLSIRRLYSLLVDFKAVKLETIVMGGPTPKNLWRFHEGPLSIKDVSCKLMNTSPLVTVRLVQGWVRYPSGNITQTFGKYQI